MTTQYTQRNDDGGSYGGMEYGGARGGEDLNFGSARSDYGKYAYGGGLDKRGRERSRGSRWRSARHGGSRSHWWGKGLMALGGTAIGAGLGIAVGAGIGAAAMYMLDPAQGKNRREMARGKITDASRKANDMIGKRSHDLRERARGIMASARKTSGTDAGGATMARSSDTISGASRVEVSTSGTPGGGRTMTS